jgi:hypothetical protein
MHEDDLTDIGDQGAGFHVADAAVDGDRGGAESQHFAADFDNVAGARRGHEINRRHEFRHQAG